jgi:two-component system chemotaxis response regulator CheY
MKVLIVDDSRAMRRLHREVLSELVEVDVAEAEDGVHAVYELQSVDFQVDLILVDWMMPRMDGLTLVRLLKSTENLRNIPILMVTSCSDERRMKEAWQAGVDGYLLKPFTKEIFLHALVALDPRQEVKESSDPAAEEPRSEVVAFLDQLPTTMRRRMLDMSVVVSFEKGQAILYHGESVEYFYFVVSGRVEEHQTSNGSGGSLVRNYGKGECFAVTELIAGDPLRSNFRSASKARIGRVPRAAFEGMLVKYPEISVTLSKYLASKARRLEMKGDEVTDETDHRDSDSDISGRLEVLDLPSLVQAINLRQKTCEIVLPEMDAVISFVHGQIISVKHPNCEGTEAFYHIMEQKPSSFRLVVKSVDVRRNIDVSTTQLLLDSAKYIDEGLHAAM